MPGHFGDRVRDLVGDRRRARRVLGAQLDDDRLAPADHVADHVAQQLMGIEVDPRHLARDLAGDLVHHRPDRRPLRGVDQPDEEIALIALVEIAAETGAGAARDRCRRRGPVLRMASTCCELAIGLRERGAGGRLVVEHEAALVHARQEAGADTAIGEIAGADQAATPTIAISQGCAKKPPQQPRVGAPQPGLAAVLLDPAMRLKSMMPRASSGTVNAVSR